MATSISGSCSAKFGLHDNDSLQTSSAIGQEAVKAYFDAYARDGMAESVRNLEIYSSLRDPGNGRLEEVEEMAENIAGLPLDCRSRGILYVVWFVSLLAPWNPFKLHAPSWTSCYRSGFL